MDSPFPGMDMAASSHPALRHLPAAGPPPVRIEVRNGTSRPIIFDVSGEEFLIGSVPGCDLRLPGTNLPPVVCLIARQSDGVRLRKLAPTLPILVNGQPVGHAAPTNLIHGDCISVGAIDIIVSIDFAVGSAPVFSKPMTPAVADDHAERTRRERDLLERERQLDEQTRELEADRILWYRRREEIERETRQAQTQAASTYPQAEVLARDHRLQAREAELDRRQGELQSQQEELLRLREQTLADHRELSERTVEKRNHIDDAQDSIREALERIRQREAALEAEFATRRLSLDDELREKRLRVEAELSASREQAGGSVVELRAQIESELNAALRQRSNELDRFQLSLREAALELREAKQKFDEDKRGFEPQRQELAERETAINRKTEEFEQRLAQIESERGVHGVELRAREEQFRQRDFELNEQRAELEKRRAELDAERQLVEKERKQYETDLVRLDRRQTALDEHEAHLAERATLIDERFERFRTDGTDLEEQVLQIDAREEQLRAEEERLARQRNLIDEREKTVAQRLAQLESQQGMLAALRTRLEHVREEQRTEAARIAEERGRLDELQSESREKLQEAERLREQMSMEQSGQFESEQLFRNRSEMLQQAVQRVRDLQQQLNSEDERLRQSANEVLAKAAEVSEREGMVQAKTDQLLEAQRRLEEDRKALKEREESLFVTEGARESLQDQLRRRAEELMNRQRDLDARATQITEQQWAVEQFRTSAEQVRAQMEVQAADLARREEELHHQADQLRQAEQAVSEQRAQMEEAQTMWKTERQWADAKAGQTQAEINDLKQALVKQAADLLGQIPEMESRAQAALDRTMQGRESLRSQLAELHAYAKQSQEDLDKVRGQVQDEVERLRQLDAALNRARAEHRHAVASFRQQLVEWQSRFSGMKQALSQGESRIERREKDIETTSQQLARQAEELQVKEREVVERHDEMHRHLNDMREWYRKKFRELVQARKAERGYVAESSDDADILPMPIRPDTNVSGDSENSDANTPVILSMQDDLDPADRKLGELLRSLELVDADTLVGLWGEARRQHRPLRQVLLAGGYCTLYQLALIESDNLSGLVLGRFRIIDRLQSTQREVIYRAFDPNLQQGTCVLRHLGEAEMADAVRPDEYRQRFGAARDLAHPNVAATLEVLEINGRPAVVQEWLTGLASSEFPAAAGSPGVWYRLLAQAALGLHTAHQAGLHHGRLTAESLLLTRDGVLKITGLGEPPWLHGNGRHGDPTAEDDLRALGQIVLGWSQLAPKRKGKKATPDGLLGLLRGLGADAGDSVPAALFPSMAALLEDIDRVSGEVTPDGTAWQKLLEHVSDNAGDATLLRQSA